MDSRSVSAAELAHCLADLERINRFTLAYRPTLRWLDAMISRCGPYRRYSVLDVGSGSGDMLRQIWRMALKRDFDLELLGIDLNPFAKPIADTLIPAGLPIRFETSDIFAFNPSRRFDFIISSLFTHHLTDDGVVRFVQWMDRHAVRGWFINDLHRHAMSYVTVKYATRLLRLDPMVQHDGPISVARAFDAAQWRRLLARAQLPKQRISVRWEFPFRYCVSCQTQPSMTSPS